MLPNWSDYMKTKYRIVKFSETLRYDQSVRSHPLKITSHIVDSVEEADALFDRITYDKGEKHIDSPAIRKSPF